MMDDSIAGRVTSRVYPVRRYAAQHGASLEALRLSTWDLERVIFDVRMQALAGAYRDGMQPVPGTGRERVRIVVQVERDCISDEVRHVGAIPADEHHVQVFSWDREYPL